ncbi:MAG TPA: SUMF1/EgtB/PvdO family nonheme iron enzyme [Lamprocystis sp. (in: g-proteobacteria)]|nr:SUMF1/EgtB/PvdO family nonheme iron enzyme [Lamprocystis sp. (in: g-proteobacteria)]
MAEPVDPLELEVTTDNATGLRGTLERMRQDAADEIARLNRKLAERELAMEGTVSSATERQALQQELTTLRHSLGEKGKILDQITQECRRLEDELENRYQEVDGLKHEVERKDTSLKAAREEVQRLKRLLVNIQEQSVDAVVVLNPVADSTRLPLPPVEPDAAPSPIPQVFSFTAGLLSGLAVLVVVIVFFWGGVDEQLRRLWNGLLQPPSAATTPPPGVGADEVPVAVGSSTTAPLVANPPTDVPILPLRPPAQPLPTRRDRLRDGTFGPTMVVLPGGTFQMGQNSLGGADSGPEHAVRLPPFLIGAYEVTFNQYDRFARATSRRFADDFGWGRGERPVVGVTWSDAQAYADWLTRQSGKRYRLPSEAEWEFAARVGARNSYPWGFRMEPGRAVCFDCGSEWDRRSTAPVGSFAPNAFGLYDMAGNALEWVADCYSAGYDGAPTDGRARILGDCTNRAARGGAFNKPSASLKTHVRAKFLSESRLNHLGFRVARDP